MKRAKKPFTRKYLIQKLQEAAVILGMTPSGRELEKLEGFPSRKAYRSWFGTLEKAKKFAGLPPSLRGMHHPNTYAARIKNKGIKRFSASLSLRFTVLHRDNFTCQYCGRSPQDGVKLEVDHVMPLKNGGKAELNNLITSCFDCNRGKRAMLLSNCPKKKTSRM